MASPKVARKVYSAEELHRLRYTQSQPKLHEAIEEHDGEDADIVKEHILRGSKSFTARSYRSRSSANSLRVPPAKFNNENLVAIQEPIRQPLGVPSHACGSVLGEIAPNGQMPRSGSFKFGPSPTPSMKKKKAEAIVKAHGSPTHVRVTAGGRIVPSEQSPLCHPRYGYSAIQTNGGLIKFAPNHHAGKPQWTRANEDGFVAQDMHGNLCQIVNGTILPLNEVDGALRLYMPAPNLQVTQRGPSVGAVTGPYAAAAASQSQTQAASAPVSAQTSEPSATSQITALELEYSKLEHELKDVDKTEVIHGRTMGKVAKDALISKRRELIVGMDKIRKALKELKSRPPPNAPTSPRAMSSRNAQPPPRSRLPPFLQMQQPNIMASNMGMLPPFNPYLPAAGTAGSYMVQPTPSPEEIYVGQSWTVPPASMFVPPPSFDGSMVNDLSTVQPSVPASRVKEQESSISGDKMQDIPQSDGARSTVERHSVSPSRSRAVSIRAPEPKSTTAMKSGLNPMSPVYKPATGPSASAKRGTNEDVKPVKARVPTPIAPFRQLQQSSQVRQVSSTSDDTISPSKKTAHLHSSSISSYGTADFFPRNTREYSTRQHAYPFQNDHIEDKENANPEQSEASPFTPAQYSLPASSSTHGYMGRTPHTAESQAPIAPPGTPTYARKAPQSLQSGQQVDLPNRDAHNISPKSKREWLFVQEHPEVPSSQVTKTRASTEKSAGTRSSSNVIDFSHKPIEWIEGYQAGLQRKPVSADRMGKFLEGYCAGLLKSKSATETSSAAAPSTSSPMKPTSRRPSAMPSSRTSGQLHLTEKTSTSSRLPLESRLESLDTLKQAVFAPQNENAILTSAADGPHISEISTNLGIWEKTHNVPANVAAPAIHAQSDSEPGYFIPGRTSSSAPRHAVLSEDIVYSRSKDKALPAEPRGTAEPTRTFLQPHSFSSNTVAQAASPSLSNMSVASSSTPSGGAANIGNRITSITSIDASMYRQWPGSHIMTPTEWKTGNSVSHAAGLATGFFANAQYDGATQMQRVGSVTSTTTSANRYGRLREGSLDGITNPATSPAAPVSPQISPHDTPTREAGKQRKEPTPSKGPSPTKAKFEQIAGKVGIKVTTAPKNYDSPAGAFEPGSPPDKRRWRDIWRKGGREGME